MGCSFVLSLPFSWVGSFCSSREPGRVSSAASVFHLFPPTCLSSGQVDEESQTRDPSWGVARKLWEGVKPKRQVLRRTLSKTFQWRIFIHPPLLPPDMLDSLFVLCDWQCGPINLTGIVTTCAFSFAARLTRPEGPERLENGEQREHNTEMWGANLGCLLFMRKLC